MTRWISRDKADALPFFSFTLSDQALLRSYDPGRSPNMQVFTDTAEEEERQQQQQNKYCPKCEGLMDEVTGNSRLYIWSCKTCSTVINSFDYDKPLDTRKRRGITIPINHRGQYASYTDSDEIPFFKSWTPAGPNEYTDWQTTYSSENGRIKTIRCPPGESPYSHSIEDEELEGGELI